jgi:hypothetical protein
VNFSAGDILTFLGRRLHWRFDGEVLTECKKDRWPGARIKHRMKGNWLKMYDKQGVVLRVETVINQPREFQVRRLRERKGKLQMVWCPMNTGIANLYQYQAAALSANVRYLEALSVVSDPAPAYHQVDELARRQVVDERSFAGFDPARRDDVALFRAVLQGDQLLHGFRNRDVRCQGSSNSPLAGHDSRPAALGDLRSPVRSRPQCRRLNAAKDARTARSTHSGRL